MIIRVDADRKIGMGHFVRCLAIADCVSERGTSVLFAISEPPTAVEDLLRKRNHELHRIRASRGGMADAAEVIGLADGRGDLVLVDGYEFSDEYERHLKNARMRIAAMDDYGHADHAVAGLIINCNLSHARASLYPRAGGAVLLMGSTFLPLRQELTRLRSRRLARVEITSLLVSFGGGDIRGTLPQTLKAVSAGVTSRIEIHVAAGFVPPAPSEHIQRELDQTRSAVHWIEDASRLPEVMAHADIAIAAGGMLSYELAYMGVPAILLPATPIQEPVAQELARLGAAIDLGLTTEFPSKAFDDAFRELGRASKTRQRMIDQGQTLFDGDGAMRCADALLRLSGDARPADSR